MSDRTNLQAYVYDCPEDQRTAAHDVLAGDYGLGLDWDARKPGSGAGDELNMTEAYTDDQMRVGSAREVAEALREAAPGASFVLWEDPAYEWLGDVFAYTPKLGMFSAPCDANAVPMFTGEQMRKLVSEATADVGASAGGIMLRKIREAIDLATGAPWFADWAAHSENT